MTERTALEQKIRALTEELGQTAAAGDWMRAADIADARLDLLQVLFTGRGAVSGAEVALIEEILETDRALNRTAEENRLDVQKKLGAVRLGREAVRVYAENG